MAMVATLRLDLTETRLAFTGIAVLGPTGWRAKSALPPWKRCQSKTDVPL